MFKRLFALVALALLAAQLNSPTAVAQAPDPAALAFAELVGYGYDVIRVDYVPDASGNPIRKQVFAQMETITTDLDDRYVVNQVLYSFLVLSQYFPGADNLVAILQYDRWLYIFTTTASDWEDVTQKRAKAIDFWTNVRRGARIYDTVSKQYVSEKDFVNQNLIVKNQTGKNFTGQAKPPLPPVNTNPGAQAENILIEPSTTYLPADGKAAAIILATLTDATFSGLPGRGVNFTYEVRGQEEKALGTLQTDGYGTARAQVISSRPLDLVLIRAATATLAGSVQVYVGQPPGSDRQAQARDVEQGLSSQGYADVAAELYEYTDVLGRAQRLAYAQVRVASSRFDRDVYSQLSRMMGTLRTLMPDSPTLRQALVYLAPDGRDYYLQFTMRADLWDAYVRGEISENQLWQSLVYEGAFDENGQRVLDRDFIAKNFSGVDTPTVSSAPRTVEATLSTETWGDQLTIGWFVVPVGGRADSFELEGLTGNASGFALYESPDYKKPVFSFNRGDAPGALGSLVLDQGQYFVQVLGEAPPAGVVLNYVEHLVR